MKKFRFQHGVLPWAAGFALALGPALGWSLDLGELSVVSAPGEPLRAEIPLHATPDELAGASVGLAGQDAFRRSGIAFRPGLRDLTLAVVHRDDRAFVEVLSAKPIDEADLHFLLELAWPSGRVLREYALPAGAAKPLAAKAAVPGQAALPPVPAAAEPAAEGAAHVVEAGENLRQIAEDRRYSGVSLEQMLLGLFRTNPEAFAGRNINRLKTGAILNVPEAAFVAAIPEGEARRFYLSHVDDWNAYRRSLAAAAAQMQPAGDPATQADSGKIAAPAQAVVPGASPLQDQVKVDVIPPGAKERAGSKAAAVADRIVQEQALKDARERLAVLEKNVEDLQRLLQVRSGDLARLQSAAQGDAGIGGATWSEQWQAALRNPFALGGFGGLLLALLLLLRRKKPITATASAIAAGAAAVPQTPPPASQPADEAAGGDVPAAPAEGFDMRRISLDLSAEPKDDGQPIWAAGPRPASRAGKIDPL